MGGGTVAGLKKAPVRLLTTCTWSWRSATASPGLPPYLGIPRTSPERTWHRGLQETTPGRHRGPRGPAGDAFLNSPGTVGLPVRVASVVSLKCHEHRPLEGKSSSAGQQDAKAGSAPGRPSRPCACPPRHSSRHQGLQEKAVTAALFGVPASAGPRPLKGVLLTPPRVPASAGIPPA